MSVGRGCFKKAFIAALLSRHTTADIETLVRAELGWNCVYCGIGQEDAQIELDHLWPESTGGCLVIGNVVPACPTCNSLRRDTPWQAFMMRSGRLGRPRDKNEGDAEIAFLMQYMEKYDQTAEPTLNSTLTRLELEILASLELMLSAVSDGALAKAGHKKRQAIRFNDPEKMFDELVSVVAKYIK